jgi:hypothetical protein
MPLSTKQVKIVQTSIKLRNWQRLDEDVSKLILRRDKLDLN